MSFTIQDVMTISAARYQIKMTAGRNGWSNSISWILLIEDTTILENFTGKELAVTLGVGFKTEEQWLNLARLLTQRNAAGLLVNTGGYVKELPASLVAYCDEFDLPLMEVPWEIHVSDMVKDLSIRIFMQDAADEQIANALISAIETPENKEKYVKELLPYYNVDGKFQIILFTTDDLKEMDTVERRKLSHQLQIYLENITHNANFFYYDGMFVLMVNDVSEASFENIVSGMLSRTKRRAPGLHIYTGIGSYVYGIENLHTSFSRALAAIKSAIHENVRRVDFDDMGIYRLLYSVQDTALLKEMGENLLRPIIDYDEKHNSDYRITLESYIRHNGSIQAVADELITHRNTIIYRITNIKKLLDCELSTFEERLKFYQALMIYDM